MHSATDGSSPRAYVWLLAGEHRVKAFVSPLDRMTWSHDDNDEALMLM